MKKLSKSLSHLFRSEQELRLEGFQRLGTPYCGLSAYLISDAPIQLQFERFASRVIAAIGHEYLPIYRMADGEFAFLVGFRPWTKQGGLAENIRALLSRIYNNVIRRDFGVGSGESYTADQRRTGPKLLAAAVRRIAERGVLGIYFLNRGDNWGDAYFDPIGRWFRRNAITLREGNYVPFYFVYALLTGPFRSQLMRGRRILVITHGASRTAVIEAQRMDSDYKSAAPAKFGGGWLPAIEQALRAEGAAEVIFRPVSATNSLFDTVDVVGLKGHVDIALVAAGIGAANVLLQLQDLEIPCIDAGICIDCLVMPTRRSERPFLLADDMRPVRVPPPAVPTSAMSQTN